MAASGGITKLTSSDIVTKTYSVTFRPVHKLFWHSVYSYILHTTDLHGRQSGVEPCVHLTYEALLVLLLYRWCSTTLDVTNGCSVYWVQTTSILAEFWMEAVEEFLVGDNFRRKVGLQRKVAVNGLYMNNLSWFVFRTHFFCSTQFF